MSGFAPDGEAKSRPRATVAGGPGGPIGYGSGTSEPCSRTPRHRVRLHDLAYYGAAMQAPAPAGVDTALSPWLRGGPHKTTLITVLAAFAATAKPTHCTFTSGRKSGLLLIEKSLMAKKAILNAQVFCAHIRWRSRFAKGMCSADPECTQH